MEHAFEVRLGAAAGWLCLVGVTLAFIVIPATLAGQPPTVNSAPAAVLAYFRHPEFVVLNTVVGAFVGVLLLVPFGFGLRRVLGRADDRARVFADIGLALMVVAVPVYLVSSVLGASLVQAADGDAATFAVLFRFYDLLYNAAADVIEGGWIGAFAIAAVLGGGLPRWVGWLGLALAVSRWVKALVPVGLAPDAVDMASGLLFLAWFLATAAALTLAARRYRSTEMVRAAA